MDQEKAAGHIQRESERVAARFDNLIEHHPRRPRGRIKKAPHCDMEDAGVLVDSNIVFR